ncbi:hypothetical protein ACIA5E_06270 [Nocardia asteroides]|uniref:hypothetical protein n=1 Tax=Nocardia asteroides TaxID=1824 RepID=UPI003790161D
MTSTSTVTADDLAARWTEFWNGALPLAPGLLADDFGIRFASPTRAAADGLRGPGEVAAFIAEFRRGRPDLTFAIDAEAVGSLDAEGTGSCAVRWHAEPTRHSGIDILTAVAGKLVRVWSVTGSDLFTEDASG